jgi:hypothetical protein
MFKERRKEKIGYSLYPAKIPSYKDWCKELNVSTAYVRTNYYTGNEINLKKLKIKTNE